jgi:hypothetical protein
MYDFVAIDAQGVNRQAPRVELTTPSAEKSILNAVVYMLEAVIHDITPYQLLKKVETAATQVVSDSVVDIDNAHTCALSQLSIYE